MISFVLWTVVEVYLVGALGFAAYAYFGGDAMVRGEVLASIVVGLRWPLRAWAWFQSLRQ